MFGLIFRKKIKQLVLQYLFYFISPQI
jgi:hypothetical protein